MKIKSIYLKILLTITLLEQAKISQAMFERWPKARRRSSSLDFPCYTTTANFTDSESDSDTQNESNLSNSNRRLSPLNKAARDCDILLMTKLILNGAKSDEQTERIAMEALEKKKKNVLWPVIVTSDQDITQEQRITRVRGHIKDLLSGNSSILFKYVIKECRF